MGIRARLYHSIFAVVLFGVFLFPPRVECLIENGAVVRCDFLGFELLGYARSEIHETRSIPFHVDYVTVNPEAVARTLVVENHRACTVFHEVLAGEVVMTVAAWGGLVLATRRRRAKTEA